MHPDHSLIFVPATPFQESELSSPYLKILTRPLILLKEENIAQVINSCFAKEASQNTDFSRLKRQLMRQKLTQHVL